MTLPLDGVRVIDFTRVLAGPHCAKHLFDLGAEVIKIEPPRGDLSRLAFPGRATSAAITPSRTPASATSASTCNVPAARDAALKLCDTADVIVENFRPGVLESFGLGYASVARNPSVVYVSISGYGQRGRGERGWPTAPRYRPRSGSPVTPCASSASTAPTAARMR